MQRSALIVAGAAGPQDIANGVLQRFGFAPAASALTIAEAAARMRGSHVDLLVIPLQGIDPVELAAIERESRKTPPTFVIGTAAQADPELILRAMRSGIHEFLVYPPGPAEFSRAVDRLMRRTHGDGGAGVAIAVYSAKGGLGTTSIAVNLAFALARGHRDGRVALADLVAGGGDVRIMLDLKPAYDLGDLAGKAGRIDAELLDSLLTPRAGGVWVLPAAEDPEVADGIDGTTIANIVEQLRAHFTFTVIDCEHALSERTLAVLDAADHLVLVTQLNVAALRSTQRTLALCQRLGYAEEKCHVVVNRHHSGDAISASDAASVLGREIFFALPNDYRLSTAALTKGVPVSEHDAASQLARSYTTLAARLDGGSAADGAMRNGKHGGRVGRLFNFGRR